MTNLLRSKKIINQDIFPSLTRGEFLIFYKICDIIYIENEKGSKTMLSDIDRNAIVATIRKLVDLGLNDHLREHGENNVRNWATRYGENFPNCTFSGGATKLCIIRWDSDWVIKVGYTERVKFDYAAKEYENYCLAEEAGLAYYFPETVYIGEFCGRAYFAQRAVECDEEQVTSDWYDCLQTCYEEAGEDCEDHDMWGEVYDLTDSEKIELLYGDQGLLDFLCERGINDLHEGNFGYDADRIVIIDFSGYRG